MPTQTHWYDVIKASNHDALRDAINTAAAQGWEPVQCWSDRQAGHANSIQSATDHFCLLRMPVTTK